MKARKRRCWVALGVLLSSIVLPGAALAAEGVQLRGSLYALGSQRRVRLYVWDMTICPELWTSRYRRVNGTQVVEDFTRFAGERLAEHGYVRHAIGERSSVRVRGPRLEFRYARGSTRKTETLTTDEVFLTGPAVFPFIRQSLPRLLAGEEIEFKFGVLDRLDYFTFVLSNQSEPRSTELVVRIRARSPFVRMAIDPIHVTLSRTGKFKGIRGRTIIMEQEGARVVPIDADLVVEAEVPTGCGAVVAPAARDAGKQNVGKGE